MRDGAGLRAQNFDLLSKPIPSKLGSDPLDDLLFRIELYNICVILPRGYILNHVYTRQFSRASLRVNVCDICQRNIIKMELDGPLFEVAFWLDVEQHELLRDDAIDDAKSLFRAVLL